MSKQTIKWKWSLQVFSCPFCFEEFPTTFSDPHIRRYYLIYFLQNCLIIAFMPLRSIRYEISSWFFHPIKSLRLASRRMIHVQLRKKKQTSHSLPVRMIQLVDLSLELIENDNLCDEKPCKKVCERESKKHDKFSVCYHIASSNFISIIHRCYRVSW